MIVKMLTPLWPNGETFGVIRKASHFGNDKAKELLSELQSEGIVKECEVTKPDRKKPRDGFKLKENPNRV